jgi:hypothetical protein
MANAYAWQEGMRRLEEAIAKGLNHAFEATLGDQSVTAKILEAAKNAYIKVYDNSAEAAADGTVPDPVLVLEMGNGQVISPAADDRVSGGRLEAELSAPAYRR